MYQEWFEIFNKIKEEGRKKMWIDWLDKVCLETNSCPMCRKEIRIKMCKFCDANSKGEILSGKPVRTYEWQKTAGYNPPEKRNDFLEMFILKNKDDKKAGLMVDSGYGYRYVDIDYCMFCGRRLGE